VSNMSIDRQKPAFSEKIMHMWIANIRENRFVDETDVFGLLCTCGKVALEQTLLDSRG